MAGSVAVTCHASPHSQDRSASQGYDLSLNHTEELVHGELKHGSPLEILAELRAIEQEILQGIEELEGIAMRRYSQGYGASILPTNRCTGLMKTVDLRQVPDTQYRRLKAVAAAH